MSSEFKSEINTNRPPSRGLFLGGGGDMEEVTRQLHQKLDDIKERLIVIETHMESLKGVDKAVMEARSKAENANNRIDKIEANLTWIWRVVAGAIAAEAFRVIMQATGKG